MSDDVRQVTGPDGSVWQLVTAADDPVSLHVFVPARVRQAVRTESARTGRDMKHIVEDALRAYLGLNPGVAA